MAVIYFYCPECKEELEAEDSIRGQRMKCPACWKEIAVPLTGIPLPVRGRARPRNGSSGPPKVVLWVVILAAVVLVGGGLWGMSALRTSRTKKVGPACTPCQGKGSVDCISCKGTKQEPCSDRECKGGKKLNFRGQEETCLVCNGSTMISCRSCGGTGAYSCGACQGTGRGE